AVAQIGERGQVRAGEVVDVDIVAHAGAVGRGVIVAEHGQLRATADRDFAGDLGQQRRLLGRLADAAADVAAGDVEVAQRDVGRAAGEAEVAQHPFAHQLRGAVRVDRRGRAVFADAAAGRLAVHRGGRREHDVAHAGPRAAGQQVARRAGVVAV